MVFWKNDVDEWNGGKIIPQELVDILCGDSTGWLQGGGDNESFPQKQTQ